MRSCTDYEVNGCVRNDRKRFFAEAFINLLKMRVARRVVPLHERPRFIFEPRIAIFVAVKLAAVARDNDIQGLANRNDFAAGVAIAVEGK